MCTVWLLTVTRVKRELGKTRLREKWKVQNGQKEASRNEYGVCSIACSH